MRNNWSIVRNPTPSGEKTTDNPFGMIKALSKSVTHCGTAIFLLLSLVLLAELWLRIDGAKSVATVTSQTTREIQSLLVPSATTHHEMRRMSHSLFAEDVVVQTNSLGLRGTPPVEPKPAGSTRILILGDETVLAAHLADEETMPRRVEQFLSHDGKKLEVINAGVPGFSPLLSWLQFRHELRALNPDVVVLHFDMSDVADDAKYRPMLKSEGNQQVCCNASLSESPGTGNRIAELMQESALCCWLKCQTGVSSVSAFSDSKQLRAKYRWTESSRLDLRLLIKHALQPIEKFHHAAQADGFRLILSTSPVPWQTVRSEEFPLLSQSVEMNSAWPVTDDLPMKVLSAVCAKSGIEFCNATPAFRQFSQPAKLFLPDDCQLSRFGTALYARVIATTLLSPESTTMVQRENVFQ